MSPEVSKNRALRPTDTVLREGEAALERDRSTSCANLPAHDVSKALTQEQRRFIRPARCFASKCLVPCLRDTFFRG
jgi:hypothetical protein